jgi:hypothetical protein
MSSEHREYSQVPRNGNYIALAATPAVFNPADGLSAGTATGVAIYDILQDMGTTVYIYNTDKTVKQVLRKVRFVKANANTIFYVCIGGDGSVVASAVARL